MKCYKLLIACILSSALFSSTAVRAEKYSMCDSENKSPAFQLSNAIKACEIELSKFGADGRDKENCSLMLELVNTPESESTRENTKVLLEAFSPELNQLTGDKLQDSLRNTMRNVLDVNPNCIDELLWIIYAERLTAAMNIINSQ